MHFPLNRHQHAVSPVVGVLLMIVIAVLLAGTIVALSTGIGDTLTTEATAGVTIGSDGTHIDISITTAGNADYVNISGDVYDHLDSDDYTEDDFREIDSRQEIQLSADDLEPDGHEGRVVAIAVKDDTETVVTSENYNLD